MKQITEEVLIPSWAIKYSLQYPQIIYEDGRELLNLGWRRTKLMAIHCYCSHFTLMSYLKKFRSFFINGGLIKIAHFPRARKYVYLWAPEADWAILFIRNKKRDVIKRLKVKIKEYEKLHREKADYMLKHTGIESPGDRRLANQFKYLMVRLGLEEFKEKEN